MEFTEEQLDRALAQTINAAQAAKLLGVSRQAVSDRLFKRSIRERQEREERLRTMRAVTEDCRSELQRIQRKRAVEESTKRTLAMFDDKERYPTIESIAQAQGVSVSTVYRRIRKRGE